MSNRAVRRRTRTVRPRTDPSAPTADTPPPGAVGAPGPAPAAHGAAGSVTNDAAGSATGGSAGSASGGSAGSASDGSPGSASAASAGSTGRRSAEDGSAGIGSASDGSADGGGPGAWAGRVDLALRIAGALVGVAGALVTAVLEAFLVPLRTGTLRLPVSILLAVVGNLLLIWFTYRTTGRRSAVLLPGLVWLVVMLRAAGRTAEGDILIAGDNWVGLMTLFAGTAAFAIGAYRMILPRVPPPAPPPPARPGR